MRVPVHVRNPLAKSVNCPALPQSIFLMYVRGIRKKETEKVIKENLYKRLQVQVDIRENFTDSTLSLPWHNLL